MVWILHLLRQDFVQEQHGVNVEKCTQLSQATWLIHDPRHTHAPNIAPSAARATLPDPPLG